MTPKFLTNLVGVMVEEIVCNLMLWWIDCLAGMTKSSVLERFR